MFEKNISTYRLSIILLLGFSSGLPLALTGSTLQAWFTVSGVSIVTIGLLSLVGQPYVYKFLWAPLFDRYTPPFLGRRRGWLLITQLGLVLSIIIMALGNPKSNPYLLAAFALLTAFLSASQDIAIDAYRTDILTAPERGLGSALYTGGYRIAMMVSGGLALILADYVGWRVTYFVMAALMSIGIFANFFGKSPSVEAKPPQNFSAALVDPLREFFSRDKAWLLLLIIVFYKLGDAMSVSLTTPFLIRYLGFSLTAVGAIYKGVGLAATLLGVFIGGIIMLRLSLIRSLILFGLLQAVAIFMFVVLALVGKSYPILMITVFIDNFCNGMGTTALVAYLMNLCNPSYTATQFALLSAIASIGRVFIGPIAGILLEHISWVSFFIGSFFLSLPGLFLLGWASKKSLFNLKKLPPHLSSA
jgi:PAT family beta-lactamase induction signal transducer AmpG